MATLEKIRAECGPKDMFEGQLPHLGIVFLLTIGAIDLLVPGFSGPVFLGWDTMDWAILSIWLAVIHQIIVAFVFRMQLYAGLMTRLFGEYDLRVWGAIFLPFLAARPLTLILVGWLDPNRITGWRGVEISIGILLVALALLTMHSVVKYFTIARALGADHFRNDVIAMPMVNRGMFKYTSNGMYGLVFLGLWGIALLFGSWNALVVALFQHVYIWVHMYYTEKPDMARLYPDGE